MRASKPQPVARLRVIFDAFDRAELIVLAPDDHPHRGEILRWLREEIPRLTVAGGNGAHLAECIDAQIGPIMFGGAMPAATAARPDPVPGSEYLVGWWIDCPGRPRFDMLSGAMLRAFPFLERRHDDTWSMSHGLYYFEAP